MPGTARRRAALALLLAGLVVVTGCTSDARTAKGRTLTVFAASSLTRAFGDMARAFEVDHPGLQVELSLAGSQALAAQIREGAPAQVIATADLPTANGLAARLDGPPVVFAHNQLALLTPAGSPKLTRLAELSGRRVVLAGPTVPVGKAAAAALAAAGVTVQPVSLEDSATGVVTKVRLGEADAGIAYATDLVSAEGIQGAPLEGTRTDLAIAAVAGQPHPADAEAFLRFVRSPAGRAIMESWGFT